MQEDRPDDLLIHGCGSVLGQQSAPEADAVLFRDGRVAAVGASAALSEAAPGVARFHAEGLLAMPGLVDAHTHPAFVRGRAEEFDWRNAGMSYLEIAARGGGIHSSVAAVRVATEDELTEAVVDHFSTMLAHGTTSCEAKSGYGLSVEDELKSLRAIHAAAARVGVSVRATCLAGHMVPRDYEDRPEDYLDLICAELLPEVARLGLAAAVDVFIEKGAFNLNMAQRYLERGKELGFGLRVHADQFHALGGTELAVELGAESVDHLEALTDAGLEALAMAGTCHAGLLPAVPHFLKQGIDAPARRLIQAGVPFFVATDFNPGSCPTPNLFEAAHFARIRLGLSAAEAFHGTTAGAAHSLGWQGRKGGLEPGCDADLILAELPDLHHFGYPFGVNPVAAVFAGGVRLR